jgi:hypothetical protein
VTLQRLKEEMSGNSHTKDVTMKTTRTHSLIAAAVCLLAVMAHASDSKIEKKQKEIRTMAQDTLQRLYKANQTPNRRSTAPRDMRSSATWA